MTRPSAEAEKGRPSALGGQMAALYAAHFVRYLLPLITIPYLARILGAEGLGHLVLIQAYAFFVIQWLEFGFGLSATQGVARHRDSPSRLATLASSVFGSQAGLLLVALGATAIVQHTVPMLGETPDLLWMGAVAGILQGSSPFWFLRGVERMKEVASLEVASRVVRTAGIFLLVRAPDDLWLVLASDLAASLLNAVVGLGLVCRLVPLRWPEAKGVLETLRESWSLFVVRASASLFSAGNVFVLGLYSSQATIAFFAGAEKIATALRMLFNPAFDALYPRMSFETSHAPDRAFRLLRRMLLILGTLSLGMSVGILIFAPLAVRLLLGPEFEASVGVLRIFALFPPVVVINLCLGSHWLLVRGHRRLFVSTGLFIGLLNILSTLVVARWRPEMAHQGAAVAFVLSQLLGAVVFTTVAWRTRPTAGA